MAEITPEAKKTDGITNDLVEIVQPSIEKMIYVIRDKQVMLDSDLAILYQVETGALNRAVKRNISRFPEDFRFQLTKDEYENNYKAMLSSVYNNMGFWISRYEIGDETATNNNYSARTDTSGTKGKTVSKRSMIPYNWVTCEEAQNLASKMSPNSNQTSSLLFGIQWDLTCKFLEENSELTYANIATDSTNWGNYSNSSIKLTKGKYNTSKFSDNEWLEIIPSVKTSTMLLTTGATAEPKTEPEAKEEEK